jgi:hypothetical protein
MAAEIVRDRRPASLEVRRIDCAGLDGISAPLVTYIPPPLYELPQWLYRLTELEEKVLLLLCDKKTPPPQ